MFIQKSSLNCWKFLENSISEPDLMFWPMVSPFYREMCRLGPKSTKSSKMPKVDLDHVMRMSHDRISIFAPKIPCRISKRFSKTSDCQGSNWRNILNFKAMFDRSRPFVAFVLLFTHLCSLLYHIVQQFAIIVILPFAINGFILVTEMIPKEFFL